MFVDASKREAKSTEPTIQKNGRAQRFVAMCTARVSSNARARRASNACSRLGYDCFNRVIQRNET